MSKGNRAFAVILMGYVLSANGVCEAKRKGIAIDKGAVDRKKSGRR